MKAHLQFSQSGKFCRILAENRRIIADLIVEGPLKTCAFNAYKNKEIKKGTANIFRGEVFDLQPGERLDVENECIIEKENI